MFMFDKICKMKNIILFKYEILYLLVMILYKFLLFFTINKKIYFKNYGLINFYNNFTNFMIIV